MAPPVLLPGQLSLFSSQGTEAKKERRDPEFSTCLAQ